MSFSYENYMNLIWHLNYSKETVPLDIAKRIISHGIAPVITVISTADLDNHVKDAYGIDSMYRLLRFFGGCVSDRDQSNEMNIVSDSCNNNIITNDFLKVPDQNISNAHTTTTTTTTLRNRRRSNSNSLLQRDHTQLQFIRFSKPLPDLLSPSSTNNRNKDTEIFEEKEINYKEQLMSETHSLELYLNRYLNLINENTTWNTNHLLLRKSLYHNFFSQTLSSTNDLSPFESFNHPVVSLFALDISRGQTYEDARDLLTTFKNLNKNIHNFPQFININDILPVFLLCYENDSTEQIQICQDLMKKFKKQLFVESVMLPLWNKNQINEDQNNKLVPFKFLHEPVMSSLDEILISLANRKDLNHRYSLPANIIDEIYNMLDYLVYDLLIPFMQRKISYWNETVMAPRKSIFHGSKFLRRFINKSNQQQVQTYKTSDGTVHFLASSNESLLRKLADWSLMISDFKTAYTTYDSLSNDLENFPIYLASCLEWCSVSLLMGAQSIVTVKMIKNDITPLIERAMEVYKSENRPILETRCMLLCTELFLSLSDSWTSTPYAIHYLETILSDGKLSSLAKTLIWERLSDCYASRIDPRIRGKIETNSNNIISNGSDSLSLNKEDNTQDSYIFQRCNRDILSKGFTRNRKAAFFRLIAAKKWAEQGNWRQVQWCLKDIHHIYDSIGLYDRHGLMLKDLHSKLQEHMTVDT